jgi:hypothetical protein
MPQPRLFITASLAANLDARYSRSLALRPDSSPGVNKRAAAPPGARRAISSNRSVRTISTPTPMTLSGKFCRNDGCDTLNNLPHDCFIWAFAHDADQRLSA